MLGNGGDATAYTLVNAPVQTDKGASAVALVAFLHCSMIGVSEYHEISLSIETIDSRSR